MTTASVLLTVGTTWTANNDGCDKEERVGRTMRNVSAVAARELRETPATREQAIRIMRDWIQKNTDIKNVRQGKFINKKLSWHSFIYKTICLRSTYNLNMDSIIRPVPSYYWIVTIDKLNSQLKNKWKRTQNINELTVQTMLKVVVHYWLYIYIDIGYYYLWIV